MSSSEPLTRRSVLKRIVGAVPSLVVLALLGGAAWWGHSTGWALPKRAALAGETKEPDDWCAEHSVPESACVECNANLLPKPPAFGWCLVHKVHECPLCHPEVAQLPSAATVTADDLARAQRALDFTARPENSPKCKLHTRRLQFASEEAANKAGIGVLPVGLGEVVESVNAPGEIGYDQTCVAHLSSRAPGAVFRVYKRIGESVKTGDLLALVEAADVGKAKSDLRQAIAALDSKMQILASLKASAGVVSDARVRDAEIALRETRIRQAAMRQALVNFGLPLDEADVINTTDEQLEHKLHFLGLPPSATKTLDPRNTTSNLLPLFAPMDGVITSRDVVAGEVVDIARVLFEVVDTSRLWVTLDVTAEQARQVKLGQSVYFKPDGWKDPEPVGTIVWRSTQADPKTRTVKVRADLHDPTGRYLANTFGTGRIELRKEPKAVVVLNSAVQWDGNCFVVFVKDKDSKPGAYQVFHVRCVRIGAKSDTQTEIIAGLLPGEWIVTKNAEVLRSELFRANLGDGCGCGH